MIPVAYFAKLTLRTGMAIFFASLRKTSPGNGAFPKNIAPLHGSRLPAIFSLRQAAKVGTISAIETIQ
jgi:hypothetical protein